MSTTSRSKRAVEASSRPLHRILWVSFGAAAVMALLVVPRPETPQAVPLPPVDWEVLVQSQLEQQQRAASALRQPLAVDIRGIGERIRRCGLLERGATEQGASAAALIEERAVLRGAVRALLQQDRVEELLQLRDLQFHLLLAAYRGDVPKPDAAELGGRLDAHVVGAEALLFDGELAHATLHALFASRFAELTGLGQHPSFRPSANQRRLIFRFQVQRLLEQPLAEVSGELVQVLASAQELSPDFPSDYARGIVLYRSGAFGEALDAFNRHLERRPDGSWTLRAQNFRLSAAWALLH